MPIYEYRCEACGVKFAVLFWPPDEPSPRCRKCGSTRARRLISRVALVHGEEDRLERLAEGAMDLDESDPRSVARWARRLGREMGEEVGEDFEQVLEEASAESSEAKGESGEDL
jgi:putative FmdB family regulatory protein